MKNWGILFLLLIPGYFKLMSQDIEINANKICNFSTDIKVKTNKIQGIVNSGTMPVSFTLNKDYAGSIFLSKLNSLKIDNFEIAPLTAVNIVLQPVIPAVDEHTEWYKATKDGLEKVEGPYIVSFSGKIEGQPNSSVFLNYFNGNIFGFIENEIKTKFNISPEYFDSQQQDVHLVYNNEISGDIPVFNPFNCMTQDYSGSATDIEDKYKHYTDEPLSTSKILQVNVLCEGSYDYYALMGQNYNNAAAYIASVMNQSSKIYQDNLNVVLSVYKVVIRTDASTDPYRNDIDLSYKLYTMPNVWRNTELGRSLVVLFANLADQPSGTVVAGISMGGTPYIGSLCNVDYGYCALGIRGGYRYPTMNYTWDVNVATHEMGHNFSAPHTHNCYFSPNMIDTCVTQTQPMYISDACVHGNAIPRPGTIMSYCHLTNATHSVELVFHPRMIAMMRRAAETSSCVSEVAGNFLSLLCPLGDTVYPAGKVSQIRWTSKNVKSINIYYSLDSGKTWQSIANFVNASDSIYNWTVPNVSCNLAKVAIMDASNNSLSDKSLTPFSILKAIVSVTNPIRGIHLGQNDLSSIEWQMTFPDSVSILFSSDGGTTWSTIVKSIYTGSYDWVIPQIISDECIIRIISKKDNTIYGESGLFSVGRQSAQLLLPKDGDMFCIGQYNDIQWTSDYVTTIILELSTDGGISWKKAFPFPIVATKQGLSWKAGNNKTNNAKFRISTSINKVPFYLDSTKGTFTIDSCATEVSDSKTGYAKNLIIKDVIPNPLSGVAKLRIENNYASMSVDIMLIDEKGEPVGTLFNNRSLINGTNVFDFRIGKLAQGNYFILVKSDLGDMTYPIKILK